MMTADGMRRTVSEKIAGVRELVTGGILSGTGASGDMMSGTVASGDMMSGTGASGDMASGTVVSGDMTTGIGAGGDLEFEGMQMELTKEGDNLLVRIEGRLDTVSSPGLEETLQANMEGIRSLTLDFTLLEFISSAGLRVLLATHKAMKGRRGVMVVRGINQEVREVFDITGFLDILNIEP